MDIFINKEIREIEVSEEIEKDIEEIVNVILEKEGMKNNYEISITFTGNREIKELNKEYRKKDSITDVLSFPMIDFNEESSENLNLGNFLLGDIVISLERAKEQSEEYGHSFKREIAYLVIHSMYHLLGYDHLEEYDKKEMRDKEKSIVRNLKIFKDNSR